MTFQIGKLDIVPYIAYNGLKWQRADLDGSNAGRTTDGIMHRDLIATKVRWDVTCRPLTGEELSLILTAISPETYKLTYTNPITNTVEVGDFYSNNFPVNFLIRRVYGVELWNGLTFPVIQI